MRTPARDGQRPDASTWCLDVGYPSGYETRYAVLCVIDAVSGMGLAVEIQETFSGHDVIRILDRLVRKSGTPGALLLDGSLFGAYPALIGWATRHGIQLKRPSLDKPAGKGLAERALSREKALTGPL